MLERLLVSILQRKLGQFLDTDFKSLKMSLWSGKIRLQNVALRPDALYTLGLPLSVKEGRVELLSIDIPWRRLGKERVFLKISGIVATAGSLGEDENFSDERLREWAWRRKQFQLQRLMEQAELGEEAEEVLAAARAQQSGKKQISKKKERERAEKAARKKRNLGRKLMSSNSFLSKLLDNLTIQVEDVHIKYEGPASRPFRFGVQLSSMTTSLGDLDEAAKSLLIDGLTIYHAEKGTQSQLVAPFVLRAALSGPSIRERMAAAVAAGELAAVGADVEVSDLDLRLSQTQLADLSRVAAVAVETSDDLRAREISLLVADRCPRPDSGLANAKVRWQYAVRRVLLEVEFRKGWRLSRGFFAERARTRRLYSDLYRKSKLKSWKAGSAEAKEMEAMERDKLTAEDIFAFRLMVEAALIYDGGSGSGGGLCGIGSGFSSKAGVDAGSGGAEEAPQKKRSLFRRLSLSSRSSKAASKNVVAPTRESISTLETLSEEGSAAYTSESESAAGSEADASEFSGGGGGSMTRGAPANSRFDESTARYVAAMVAGGTGTEDGASTIGEEAPSLSGAGGSSAGSSGLMLAPAAEKVEHKVRLTLRSAQATLSTVSSREIVHIHASDLVAAVHATMQFGGMHATATGTLSRLEVLDRSAPAHTLACTLVQLLPVDGRPALEFEWKGPPPPGHPNYLGVNAGGASLGLTLHSSLSLVIAPLLIQRLVSFLSVVSQLQGILQVQQLRNYMRHVMWEGAKGEDLLVEVIKNTPKMELSIGLLRGARVHVSDQLADSDATILVLELGKTQVSMPPPPPAAAAAAAASSAADASAATPPPVTATTSSSSSSSGNATAAAAAAVACASLKRRVTSDELDPVRSTLYNGLHVDIAEVRLVIAPPAQTRVTHSGTRVSFQLPTASGSSGSSGGGGGSRTRRRSTVSRKDQHRPRELLSIGNGLEVSLETCILPPACHGLVQGRVLVAMRSPTSAFGSLVYDVPAKLQESVREHSKKLQRALLGERDAKLERRHTTGWSPLPTPPSPLRPRQSRASSLRDAFSAAAAASAAGDELDDLEWLEQQQQQQQQGKRKLGRKAAAAAAAAHQQRVETAKLRAKLRARHVAELAAARANGVAAGIHEAVRAMRGDALKVSLCADDIDAVDAVVTGILKDMNEVRSTLSGRGAALSTVLRATFSSPPSLDVMEAMEILSSADNQKGGRMEVSVTVPGASVHLTNAGYDHDDEIIQAATGDVKVTILSDDDYAHVQAIARTAFVDDLGKTFALKPSRVLDVRVFELDLKNPKAERRTTTGEEANVHIKLTEAHLGWLRPSIEKISTWKLPICALPRIEPLLERPPKGHVKISADVVHAALFEAGGPRRFALEAHGLNCTILTLEETRETTLTLKGLSLYDMEHEPCEMLSSSSSAVPPSPSSSSSSGKPPPFVFLESRQRLPCFAPRGPEEEDDEDLLDAITLTVQPFLLRARRTTLLSTRRYALGEVDFVLDRLAAMGLRPDSVKEIDELPKPMPKLSVEMLGASVRLLLDAGEGASDGGVQLRVGKISLRDGGGGGGVSQGGGSGGGGSDGEKMRSRGGLLIERAGSGGGGNGSGGGGGSPPPPIDRLVVRLEEIELSDVEPASSLAAAASSPFSSASSNRSGDGGGGGSSCSGSYAAATGARLLHEAMIELGIEIVKGRDPPKVVLKGGGSELVGELTRAQIGRVMRLQKELQLPPDPHHAAALGERRNSNGSSDGDGVGKEAEGAAATYEQGVSAPQGGLSLALSHPHVALTVSERAGAALLSTLLLNLHLDVQNERVGEPLVLSAAVGAWELRGGRPLERLRLYRNRRLLSSSSSSSSGTLVPRPVLRVVRGVVHAPPSNAKSATVGVSGACCESRVSLYDGFMCCAPVRRCCALFMPLIRLVCLLCCCLEPVRNAVCLGIPYACELLCCWRWCSDLAKCCCHPSVGRVPRRKPSQTDSIELLEVVTDR